MPRANRFHVPGLVWHITQRCHNREFLLKFARDRMRWRYWLFEARQRFRLSVLDFMITRNHVHLLVRDTEPDCIARSMQLVAARVAQEYNLRKKRRGAFWEDRYFATAVATDSHLHRCMVYIDLNMVRAGVVQHPSQWPHAGYNEIQNPPERYRIIDYHALCAMWGCPSLARLQSIHREWVEHQLLKGQMGREPFWSESVAVGGPTYISSVRECLGLRALHRTITAGEEGTLSIQEC